MNGSGKARAGSGPWWGYPLHQFMATWGTAFAANFILGSVLPYDFSSRLLTETRYFPVQIALGFLFGLLVTNACRQRFALWAWVVPLVILAVAFAATPLPLGSRFAHFFGDGCRVGIGCLGQLDAVMPFYASVAYALGAALALRHERQCAVSAEA